jgi:hypothetical protein
MPTIPARIFGVVGKTYHPRRSTALGVRCPSGQVTRVIERLLRDKRDRLGTYLLKRTAIFQPSMVVDYRRARCYGSA